jgi:type IV pilus assembly protein PilP
VKGSVAIAAIALVVGLQAQEHKSAPAKSRETAQKPGRASAGDPDRSKTGPVSEAPGAASKTGADGVRTRDAVPGGNIEVPEIKPAPVAGGQRPAGAVRRDPFRPINLNLRANVRRRENLSPLERYEIGQLKLVGVIWDIKNPTALVEDSTGLGYTVKVGTAIGPNDGKIKAIKPDALIIEEEYIDLYGVKKRQEVSMRLPVEKSE